jgi:predicted PurR-regulated permease PerM
MAEVKIAFLLSILLFFVIIISFMIIVSTIGNIHHLFDRIEDIIVKESLLRMEYLKRELEIKQQATKLELERKRRTEALLNVPLVASDGPEDIDLPPED